MAAPRLVLRGAVMGSRGVSQMGAKEIASRLREQKHDKRERRDDGFRRMRDDEADTALSVRASSRKTKGVYVPAYARFKHEMFVRARMTEEQRAARDGFMPLASVSPKGTSYGGAYRTPDTIEEIMARFYPEVE